MRRSATPQAEADSGRPCSFGFGDDNWVSNGGSTVAHNRAALATQHAGGQMLPLAATGRCGVTGSDRVYVTIEDSPSVVQTEGT
ncbi:MAG TPA: hypothetical protein VF001_08435, partial [Candidatus Limnocylindria bacterium]